MLVPHAVQAHLAAASLTFHALLQFCLHGGWGRDRGGVGGFFDELFGHFFHFVIYKHFSHWIARWLLSKVTTNAKLVSPRSRFTPLESRRAKSIFEMSVRARVVNK